MESVDYSIIMWGRVIERMFIVLFSGVSLVLGWHLFIKGVIPDQEAEGGFGDWKITLRRVGPGVFFALFGSIIFAFSLSHPLEIGKDSVTISNLPGPGGNDPTKAQQIPRIKYFWEDEKGLRRSIRAINTFLTPRPADMVNPGGPVTAQDIEQAQSELQSMRYLLMLTKFNSGSLEAWSKYGSGYLANPTSAPPQFRNDLEKVAPWFNETIAMEPNK